MMPTFLGQPFYPGGFPLPQQNITTHINNQTIWQLKIKYWNQETSQDEEEILREYVLYYIGCPLFTLSFDNDEQEKKFKGMPLDNMLEILLDAGLDPL